MLTANVLVKPVRCMNQRRLCTSFKARDMRVVTLGFREKTFLKIPIGEKGEMIVE